MRYRLNGLQTSIQQVLVESILLWRLTVTKFFIRVSAYGPALLPLLDKLLLHPLDICLGG